MKSIKNFFLWFLIGWLILYGALVSQWVLQFWTLQAVQQNPFTADNVNWSWQFDKYNFIYTLLQESYYDSEKLDIQKMQENALKGFVDAIWDPFTVYLTPDENKIFDEWMHWSQEFEWIWAVVTKKDDWVMIEMVLKWSPAFKAWLKPLDMILEIDWESTQPLWLNDAVMLIRWEKWSEVVLTIYREESEEALLKVPVIRDEISVPSVESELIEYQWKSLLYITISIFWDDTVSLFENAIKQNLWVDWVIIDLRWNGGWYLPSAVTIASHFLPKNEIVTTGKYSIFDNEVFRSSWFKTLQDTPTVVLIDSMSASASEIIATALHERAWALLVWETTFGKWSIQTLHSNEDWSSIKYTIWKWYTPNDANVDGQWVKPDYEVALDINAYVGSWVDSQLDRAKDEIITLINK